MKSYLKILAPLFLFFILGCSNNEIDNSFYSTPEINSYSYNLNQQYNSLKQDYTRLTQKYSTTIKKDNVTEQKYVALTFDDGPSRNYTQNLLDELKKRDVKATFFLCGEQIQYNHHIMNRYLSEGHSLGNHSMTHPDNPLLADLPKEELKKEMTDANDLFIKYTGEKPKLMRAVQGVLSPTLKEVMTELDLAIINWNLDTFDWRYRNSNYIKNRIVNNVKDGDVVLLHDIHKTTIPGVLAAIDILKDKGFKFVTIEELAKIKGVSLVGGKVYSRFR